MILLIILALSWIWIIYEWVNAPMYDEYTDTWYKKKKG